MATTFSYLHFVAVTAVLLSGSLFFSCSASRALYDIEKPSLFEDKLASGVPKLDGMSVLPVPSASDSPWIFNDKLEAGLPDLGSVPVLPMTPTTSDSHSPSFFDDMFMSRQFPSLGDMMSRDPMPGMSDERSSSELPPIEGMEGLPTTPGASDDTPSFGDDHLVSDQEQQPSPIDDSVPEMPTPSASDFPSRDLPIFENPSVDNMVIQPPPTIFGTFPYIPTLPAASTRAAPEYPGVDIKVSMH